MEASRPRHHPYAGHRSPGDSSSGEEFFLGPSDMLLHHIMKTAEMNSFYDGNSQNRSPGLLHKSKKKSAYKHVPHSEKPPALVAKRNARERRRVQAVNGAFTKLRRHIPYENKNKRLSKVKTLKIAIDYIHHLEDMIDDYDTKVSGPPAAQRAPLSSSPGGADDNCQNQASLGYLPQGQNSEVYGSAAGWPTMDQVSPSSVTSGSSLGQGSEHCSYRVPQHPSSYLWGQTDINQDLCYSAANASGGSDYNRTVMNQNMPVMHSHTL